MKLLEIIFTKQRLNDRTFIARFVLALMMILLLVGQLFTYETFADVITAAHVNFSSFVIMILVVLLPIYELAAIPALLSMDVAKVVLRVSSYVARFVSILMVIMVANTLVVVPGESTGLLGDTIIVPAHIVTLLLMSLYAAAVWYVTIRQVEQAK